MRKIAISGAAGHIGYHLLFRIASGEVFGHQCAVSLSLLEREGREAHLMGIALELEDCAFPLLHDVKIGVDPYEAFRDADYIILLGSKPRGQGMDRSDLLLDNAKIFIEQGKALSGSQAKILIVGNPCNTNALIVYHNTNGVSHEQIRCMTRLDQNRAITQLAKKAHVSVSEISCMGVYGNHSSTMVPDYYNAKISQVPVTDVIEDLSWLQGEFIHTVRHKGEQIIAATGSSSVASAGQAVICSLRDWEFPTPQNDWFAAGVYDEQRDLFISRPLRDQKVIPVTLDSFLEKQLHISEKELMEERESVREYL